MFSFPNIFHILWGNYSEIFLECLENLEANACKGILTINNEGYYKTSYLGPFLKDHTDSSRFFLLLSR